ncbi:unnamed protein product [Ceratitis capitata]|uniref:(Mediterranean fruit fly) hypothetical protein n=1 Tax=Ceratitis capitata TaxID=7213 RepID=A0A811UUL9_CERCA|nr:unnamed protein product [Ceratitis capitata]
MMTAEALSIFAYWLDETSENGSGHDDDLEVDFNLDDSEVDPTYLADLDDGIQNIVAYNQSYVQSTSAHVQEDVGMLQIDLQYACVMISFPIGMCYESIFAYWLDETSQNGSGHDVDLEVDFNLDDSEVDPTYLADLDDGIQNIVAYNQSYVQSTSAHVQEDVGMSQIDLQYI